MTWPLGPSYEVWFLSTRHEPHTTRRWCFLLPGKCLVDAWFIFDLLLALPTRLWRDWHVRSEALQDSGGSTARWWWWTLKLLFCLWLKDRVQVYKAHQSTVKWCHKETQSHAMDPHWNDSEHAAMQHCSSYKVDESCMCFARALRIFAVCQNLQRFNLRPEVQVVHLRCWAPCACWDCLGPRL